MDEHVLHDSCQKRMDADKKEFLRMHVVALYRESPLETPAQSQIDHEGVICGTCEKH